VNAIPFTFDPVKHQFDTQLGPRYSVTQILAKNGIIDFSFVEEETRLLSMARGNSVHWLTQLEDAGGLDYRRVPKSLRGYRKAWNLWKQRSGVQITSVETPFVSRFGYAGIIDRTGTFPPSVFLGFGSSAVIDIKSGPIGDWTRYQLAAYAVWAAGDSAVKGEFVRRIAIHLNPLGEYKVREFPLCTFRVDWAKFMSWTRKANG